MLYRYVEEMDIYFLNFLNEDEGTGCIEGDTNVEL